MDGSERKMKKDLISVIDLGEEILPIAGDDIIRLQILDEEFIIGVLDHVLGIEFEGWFNSDHKASVPLGRSS